MMRLFPVLLWLVACEPEGDDDGKRPDLSETDDTATATAGVNPYVVSVAFATCNPDSDGVDFWAVEVSVGDPQGSADIASFGSTLSVVNGGTTLATYDMACLSGGCSTSWQSTDDNIDCDLGRDSTFRVVIVDESGNASEPFDHRPA